jgi:hypothetical protein
VMASTTAWPALPASRDLAGAGQRPRAALCACMITLGVGKAAARSCLLRDRCDNGSCGIGSRVPSGGVVSLERRPSVLTPQTKLGGVRCLLSTVDRLHSKGSLRRPMCLGLDAHLDRQDLPGYQLPLLAPSRKALGMSGTAASCCRWRDRQIMPPRNEHVSALLRSEGALGEARRGLFFLRAWSQPSECGTCT